MKNLLKLSIALGSVVALAGSVNATPTLIVEDGTGGSLVLDDNASSASGSISYSGTTSDGDWHVTVIGANTYPQPGYGTATAPEMDISISANYVGTSTSGDPLAIYFGGDSFGPTSGHFLATLNSILVPLNSSVSFDTYEHSGNVEPTTGSLLINSTKLTAIDGVTTTSTKTSSAGGTFGAPYSLEEAVFLTGAAFPPGSTFSIDANLQTIPDGGMTLVFLGSALSGLALLKRKLS